MSMMDPMIDPDDAEIDLRQVVQVWRGHKRAVALVTAVAVVLVAVFQIWQFVARPVVHVARQTVRFALDSGRLRDGHVFRTAEIIAPSVLERAAASLGPSTGLTTSAVESSVTVLPLNPASGEYALVYEGVPTDGLRSVGVVRLLRGVIEGWQRDRVVERLGRVQPDRWMFSTPASAESPFARADQLRVQLVAFGERMKTLEERYSMDLVPPSPGWQEFRALRAEVASGLAQRLVPAMTAACRSGGLSAADATYLKARRAEVNGAADEQQSRAAAARFLVTALAREAVPRVAEGGADVPAGAGGRGGGPVTSPAAGGGTTPRTPEAALLQKAGIDLLEASYGEARQRRELSMYDAMGCAGQASGASGASQALTKVVDDLGQLAERLNVSARALEETASLEGLDYTFGPYTAEDRRAKSVTEVLAWVLLTLLVTPTFLFALAFARHLRQAPGPR